MRDFLLKHMFRNAYSRRLAAEMERYDATEVVNNLPDIYNYWSNTYLRPMLEEFGFSNPIEFFATEIHRLGLTRPTILSLGAGNCDLEVGIARSLVSAGVHSFRFDCLDISQHMLRRGRDLAVANGFGDRFGFIQCDINKWQHADHHDVVIANQSLHHVVQLEHLLEQVRCAIGPEGLFLVSDMIGRNGHMRWPEALAEVQRFWGQMPAGHRYNHQLMRFEAQYENWDCSREGFEGIRAQDILPLLISRFHFRLFIAFGNVVDVFLDRGFGPNFDIDSAWDREFIDRVHARDEELLATGVITPTHLMAVLSAQPCAMPRSSRGLLPERCVRRPTRAQDARKT
jgi:SAM-dependent methyltransferase